MRPIRTAAARDLGTLFHTGVLTNLSDAQLIERYTTRRDDAAFEALVGRHAPLVWNVCRRVLDDHRDAEDAFQATFLVLVDKAGSIRVGDSLGPRLRGVAVNQFSAQWTCIGRAVGATLPSVIAVRISVSHE